MQYTKEQALERLLNSISRYYTVSRLIDGKLRGPDEHRGIREAAEARLPAELGKTPLAAICEYYETSGEHFIFRSNELWSTHQEEFIFVFVSSVLTREAVRTSVEYARSVGMEMAHIGSGHMYTYISPIFICDSAEPDAIEALQNCKIYKSFKFSLHGWMEVHAACVEVGAGSMCFNKAGRCMEKALRRVFTNK